MKLELIAVPVSDVDRAKAFYVDKAGFNADHDHAVSDEIRFVQLTPPGSACSISIGKGLTQRSEPGSVEGLQMVVEDAEAARAELAGRGVEVSEVQDFPWGRFVFFQDPDGNGWALQQLVPRAGDCAASRKLAGIGGACRHPASPAGPPVRQGLPCTGSRAPASPSCTRAPPRTSRNAG